MTSDHDHVHSADCNHDNDHDHDHGQSGTAPGVDIANAIIDMANTHIEAGVPADEVASGLRHAAANFSAFAFFATDQDPKDPNAIVEDFTKFLEYYLDQHRPADPAAGGLKNLIEQAKGEL